MISIDKIKQLREETCVSVSECKKALEQAGGDFAQAKEILRKWGRDLAGRKTEREAGNGIVESYIHPDKRIGSMVELHCETDFVAKSDDFKTLAHELCLQAAAIDSEEGDLMSQVWIKDETKTIKELVEEYVSKLGENIEIKRFIRFEI